MSEEKKTDGSVENKNAAVESERNETTSAKQTDEVVASKDTGGDIVGITDDDIEEMSVDELAKTVERPKKSTGEKEKAKETKKSSNKFNQSGAKRFWKKYKGLVIFLIILIAGIILFMNLKKKTEEQLALATQPEVEYALIEKQDIRDAISTTGTIVSPKISQVISSFRESTKITNVYYEVGDHVNEGDVIVTYSTENIEKSIANKKEDIAINRKEAALNAEDTERTYIDSYGQVSYNLETSNEEVETALKALYEACDAYGDAKRAQESYMQNYDGMKDKNPGMENYYQQQVSTAYQQEQTAQKAYSDAVARLANTNRTSTSSLASAETTKEKAALSAQKTATALARDLENYEDSLEDYIVTAPISGIVTKVDVEEGNGFTTGNVMTIQRDDVLNITTEIDEYDIPFVKEGQKVIIKTDATQDDELEGVVIDIAPTATTASGATAATGQSTSGVTYTVKIEIITKDERLKLGMSTKINIITEERAEVLVVRYDAIEEDENGHYVRVVDNRAAAMTENDNSNDKKKKDKKGNGISVVGVDGKPTGTPSDDETASNEPPSRNVYVDIGIEGDYYTQIISDEISEGMQVLVTSDFEITNPFELMMGGGRP